MEIEAQDTHANITVYGSLPIDAHIDVHAWINGEYEYVGEATWEVLGDGFTTFSFDSTLYPECEFLFQLWVNDEVVQWETCMLSGLAQNFTSEVVVDGSTATITINGLYDDAAYVEAMANVDGLWGTVGQAAHIYSFADLHTYTYTHTEPIGREYAFSLILEGMELLLTDIVWLEGMTSTEW